MGNVDDLQQIKQMTAKKQQLVQAKETLAAKVRGLNDKDISEQGLIDRLQKAVERLEQLPKEQQRPILKEVIHSIEIRPMKLKIGFFAPKKSESTPAPEPETKKATGTDGFALNLNLKSELASVIPFDPSRRAGSSTVGNGALGRT